MKRTAIYITNISFILLSIITYSQTSTSDYEMKWSKRKIMYKYDYLDEFVCQDETGIYAIEVKKTVYGLKSGVYYLDYFDKRTKHIKSKRINLKEGGKKRTFEKACQLNDKLYIFSSFLNQKHKKLYLFAQSVNKNTLQFNPDLKMIAEVYFYGNSEYTPGGFEFDVSDDTSKLMVYAKGTTVSGSNDEFGIHVFDHDLNELLSKEVELPYKENNFVVHGHRINNFGQVFLTGEVVPESDEDAPYIVAIRFSNDDESYNELPLLMDSTIVTGVKLDISPDQDAVCGGYYTTMESDTIKGCFYFTIDAKSMKIKSKCQQLIDPDFVSNYMIDSEEDRKFLKSLDQENMELSTYYFGALETLADGSVVLIGEQEYSWTYQITGLSIDDPIVTTHSHSITNYFSADIMVISMSDGRINWMKNVPKKQRSINDHGPYSSYLSGSIGNEVILVYNDHPYNSNTPGDGTPYEYLYTQRSTGPYLVTFDDKGTVSKEKLFSVRDKHIYTLPASSAQFTNNDLVLFCRKKKVKRFVALSLK